MTDTTIPLALSLIVSLGWALSYRADKVAIDWSAADEAVAKEGK